MPPATGALAKYAISGTTGMDAGSNASPRTWPSQVWPMVLSFGSPYSIWYAVTSASAMGAAAALTYSLRSTSGTALDGLIAPSSHPTTLPAYSFMTASPVDAPRPDTEKESGTEPSSPPDHVSVRSELDSTAYDTCPSARRSSKSAASARISARGVTARWRPRATARSGPRALRRHASRVNCPRARRGGAKQARAAVVIPGARVLVTEHR